jgi:hypothetical protein
MAKFEMNPFVHKWVQRRALTNMWRMPNWMSEADLVQDGKFCWSVVNEKYDDVVTEVAHMVALFKTTYTNHITDLAKNVRNPRGETSLDAMIEDVGDLILTVDDPDVNQLILEAPEPVQSILRLLTEDTERILTAPYRIYLDGRRDTLNNRLHRALVRKGVDADAGADLLKLVRDYLKPRRERLYDEPSVVEVVSALVDARFDPPPCKPHARLHYPPHLVTAAKDKVRSYLKPKAKRQRIFPIVEVKNARGHDYAEGRVRRGTSHPKPRQQVPECARTPVRSRVHGDWRDCNYGGSQRPGDGRGLQRPQAVDDRAGSRPMGSCDAGVGSGQALDRCSKPAVAAQDSQAAVHPDGRGPRRARSRTAGDSTARPRTKAHARAAVRNAELLG